MTIFSEDEYYTQHFKQLACLEQNITNVVFEECQFEGCDFSGSSFENCSFIECDFSRCNLSLVSFKGTRFSETVFKDSKLLGIDWTRVNWPSIALDSLVAFEKSVLNDGSFFGLTLQRLKIKACRCVDVDFTEGDFKQANFSDSDFSGSTFSRTNLEQVDFSDAQNCHINITNNRVKGAKFSAHQAVNLLSNLGIELVD